MATIRNLKANAENGSLLSTIGLVVTKADDHKKIKAVSYTHLTLPTNGTV